MPTSTVSSDTQAIIDAINSQTQTVTGAVYGQQIQMQTALYTKMEWQITAIHIQFAAVIAVMLVLYYLNKRGRKRNE